MEFVPVQKKKEEDEEEEEVLEPVSPTAQHYNSSTLSITSIAVFEMEDISDDSITSKLIHDLFLPINSRFSSIMVTDDHGKKKWKKVTVKYQDHVKVPSFPPGLSKECYDVHLDDYLSKITGTELPKHQPLWEIHIFRYPTTKAVETVIFKLHHALGDGFSLMGALFSRCHRVDDPSVPVSLPFLQSKSKPARNEGTSIPKTINFLSLLLNTTTDFTWSLLKSSIMEDDVSPIRSGIKGMEFHPIKFSTLTFSLEDIKLIKNKVKGTVNDVMTGIIFYGTRIYMQNASKASQNANSTAIILLNTRVLRTYQTINEIASGAKSAWGNQSACIYVSIPKTSDAATTNPLEFIYKAKEMIKKKRSSLAVYLTASLLHFLSKLQGHETAARHIHSMIKNASMGVSNMIGPSEQIAVANHRCKGMYFMIGGVPHSVQITMTSYMGNLRVSVGTEKEYMDHKLFTSSLELAFNRIFDAALTLP